MEFNEWLKLNHHQVETDYREFLIDLAFNPMVDVNEIPSFKDYTQKKFEEFKFLEKRERKLYHQQYAKYANCS